MIYEAIVTTIDKKGQPHCAPMGVSKVSAHFVIKPFKSSTTYDNLQHHGQCSVNFVDDVRVFAGVMTGKACWSFLPCQQIKGYYLSEALTHVEVSIFACADDGERVTYKGNILNEISHASFRGFNRAQAAVIEAAILVSRLQILPAEKIKQEINYLAIAIGKTAGKRELEAWSWLIDKIKQAGIKING